MRIDCETIPDPHPPLETSETAVIASQGTQACGDELVVTGTSVYLYIQDIYTYVYTGYSGRMPRDGSYWS